jgi:hypothetical protein
VVVKQGLSCVACDEHKNDQTFDCCGDSVAVSLACHYASGQSVGDKKSRMAQALQAFKTNRSAATSAAMWEQVRRDDLRDSRRKDFLFALMLLADAVVIYFFWNYGVKKATA